MYRAQHRDPSQQIPDQHLEWEAYLQIGFHANSCRSRESQRQRIALEADRLSQLIEPTADQLTQADSRIGPNRDSFSSIRVDETLLAGGSNHQDFAQLESGSVYA